MNGAQEVPAASPDLQEPAPDKVPAGADSAADVLERAHAWLAQDPDGETRTELRALIEAAESGDEAAVDELADRFSTRLAFGTAGLRGALGAGSNRMNRVLVAQAAAGLAAYVREQAGLPPVASAASDAAGDADADGGVAAQDASADAEQADRLSTKAQRMPPGSAQLRHRRTPRMLRRHRMPPLTHTCRTHPS